jgi:hypothetical protein
LISNLLPILHCILLSILDNLLFCMFNFYNCPSIHSPYCPIVLP